MADEVAQERAPAKKKRFPLIVVVVLGIAIAEAAVFFFVFKSAGGGPTAALAAGHGGEGAPAEKSPAEDGAAPEGESGGGHGANTESAAGHSAKTESAGGHTAKGESGAGHGAEEAPPAPVGATVELPLLRSFRVPNDKSGRTYIYDMEIGIVVPGAAKERAENLIKQRSAEIGDRLGGLVRAAPHKVLAETDLRTLRYQMLEALREIAGDEDLVQRILIPRFVPIRSE